MFNEDQFKMIQRALDYMLTESQISAHPSKVMTSSERQCAKAAYEKCDRFIDGEIIASTWEIDDVKGLQDDEDEFDEADRITDEEAKEVLKLADNNHDATVGINWEVLQAHLDYVREG